MKNLEYTNVIDQLLSALEDREREVLVKRYCLGGEEKCTLEEIGQTYEVTRERVRQIENDAIKAVREAAVAKNEALDNLYSQIDEALKKHGGFIGQDHLISHLLKGENNKERMSVVFILDKIADLQFQKFDSEKYDTTWHQEHLSESQITSLIESIAAIIKTHGQPISFEDLSVKCQGDKCYAFMDQLPAQNHNVLEAILRINPNLKKNYLNQWGIAEWPSVTPKRMADKAYLVMVQLNKPLHFKDVATEINQANFDHKKANAATVHNELILDKRFVLVGRGLYALKAWGFEQGTVSDIIAKVLKENGALSKEQLMEKVMDQRMVQKSTIMLALMNKGRFGKNEENQYQLV